jgi:hypothetical protein
MVTIHDEIGSLFTMTKLFKQVNPYSKTYKKGFAHEFYRRYFSNLTNYEKDESYAPLSPADSDNHTEVEGDDATTNDANKQHDRFLRRYPICVWPITLLISCILCTSLGFLLHMDLTGPCVSVVMPAEPTDCGDTSETARQRGCHFDVISFAWKVPECFDGELMEQFLAERPWKWSLDENGTKLIDQDDIRTGVHDTGWVT